MSGRNGDLWSFLQEIVEARSLRMDMAKVKSHAEKQMLLGELCVQEYVGNLLADAGAGAASEDAIDNSLAKI